MGAVKNIFEAPKLLRTIARAPKLLHNLIMQPLRRAENRDENATDRRGQPWSNIPIHVCAERTQQVTLLARKTLESRDRNAAV